MKIDFPPDLTSLNIKAYLFDGFNICGCSEMDKVIYTIKELLQSIHEIDKYVDSCSEMYYDQDGVYYLMVGILDKLDLIEHGTSIRFPWLTEKGKKLLDALNSFSPEEIDKATGEAYNGSYYES